MKNKSHKLKLNKDIYTKTAIEAAIKSFAHLAVFILESDEKYHIVNIAFDDETDVSILCDEFANYVLYLMKNT